MIVSRSRTLLRERKLASVNKRKVSRGKTTKPGSARRRGNALRMALEAAMPPLASSQSRREGLRERKLTSSKKQKSSRGSAPLFICLVHHPVTNKRGDVVATSITTFDLHDIARSSITFGVKRY